MKKISLFLLIPLLLVACQSTTSKNQKPTISVSIFPEKFFVEQIVGDDFNVNVVISSGSSHSDYEPSPSELNDIYQSVAYFKMGQIGFEYTVLPKIISSSQLKIFDLSEGIDFENIDQHHCCEHHGIDPHIWLSPKRVKIIAQNICKAVSDLSPQQSSKYQERLDIFLQRLDSLDQVITAELAPLEHHSFMIYHPALTYFAEDYHLHQFSIEMEGKEPSVAWLNEITQLIQKNDIKMIFIQSQYDTKNAQAISDATGAELVVIDPMSEDWMNEMLHIAHQFVIYQ